MVVLVNRLQPGFLFAVADYPHLGLDAPHLPGRCPPEALLFKRGLHMAFIGGLFQLAARVDGADEAERAACHIGGPLVEAGDPGCDRTGATTQQGHKEQRHAKANRQQRRAEMCGKCHERWIHRGSILFHAADGSQVKLAPMLKRSIMAFGSVNTPIICNWGNHEMGRQSGVRQR
ncbi:hypothetical protein LP415_09050 [Polaromonas sp. P1(28)-8]|nr:hypothetical protein LP415_09050 [Polaromonas sp. P1(28)-8]